MIPYGRQQITADDKQAVLDVLDSPFLTQGPVVPAFEHAVAAYTGAAHAVAVSNATAALHIACLALGLGPGDIFWSVPNTFVASANCGLYCGADIDFVDIDPKTYCISPDALEEKLVAAEQTGRLPKVVVPVAFSGQSCDMRRIRMLANRFDFKIIEDASHAIGGDYLDHKIGACRYADIVVFSFHPVKIITTGEGGMALTNNAKLAASLASLRTHGISRDPGLLVENHGPWYYEQSKLGYNYRLTDIQAALGTSQLSRLDTFITRRREIAARYDELLSDLPLDTPWQSPDGRSAWHLYVIQLHKGEIAKSRREAFETMRSGGVGVNVHYSPVHLQPYYRALGFGPGMFPHSEAYYDGAITLPMFPLLTDEAQDKVVSVLKEAII